MNTSIRVLIVPLALALAACDQEPTVTRAVDQAVIKEILTPAADPDRALADKVEKALGIDAGALPYGVEVTASDGKVELWGTVDSNGARKRFEVIAAGVVGVRAVENRLQVDPGA